ncbi:MAG: ROK family transcriptional regulator [Ardenticatenales bacterium]|nr:ROK family transcriptional regulator [Ardenticatenales bacterium]
MISDPNDVRENNLRMVLDMIREAGTISRVDIARAAQLSRSTITNVVNELLPTDLIHESGTVSSVVGRRPILLEFNYDARALLGVDMGASHLTVVAMNLGGRVLAIRRESFPVLTNPDQSIAEIQRLLREVQAEAGYDQEKTWGIGIAVPSPLEGEKLDRLSPIIMSHWIGVDLKREIRAAMRLPVFVDNDANMGALAEKWWGHGREVHNLAFIKVATGVGCGLIINDTIYRGEGGTAGEIGHTSIDVNGPLCRCGLRGCLEAMTGVPAILAAVQAELDNGRPSLLAGKAVTVADVVAAARAGDPMPIEVIQRAGRYLGLAIANLLNLVNPGLIVLGGSVTEAGDMLLSPLRQTVRERSFAKSNAEATITMSRLGEDAVAVGAATLVIQQLLHVPGMPILQVIGGKM